MRTKAPTSLELPLADAIHDASLAEDAEHPLHVSELLELVSETLRDSYSGLLVIGEITSFKRVASGHCYFTLADDDASLDAVMWRSVAARLTFDPEVGDEVVCRGSIDVYAKQGRMQLYVEAMRPLGAGAAQAALEALKRKLQAEGLFDASRKRPLPFFPGTIGVVTSRAGAALHDILTTIRRRCRPVRVVVSPAAVQGADAPHELLDALHALERYGRCDVVIIGRGGGAAEDLAAFNDEALVRAVAAFTVPVVSAVGHEVDMTLCDFAADRRAPTPTAAAELVVPVYAELCEQVDDLAHRLHAAARRQVAHLRHRVGSTAGRLKDPITRVAMGRQRVDELAIAMERALVARHRLGRECLHRLDQRLCVLGRSRVEELAARLAALHQQLVRGTAARAVAARTHLTALGSKLDALSPMRVLERGYSLAERADGRLVRSSEEIAPGDELRLRFSHGRARTRVLATQPERRPGDKETSEA